MMDLPNRRGTKTEVKILLRFNRNSKFLTAQRKTNVTHFVAIRSANVA